MEVDDSGGGGDDEGEALPMVEERVVGRKEEVLIANDEGEGEGDHDMDVVVVVHDDMDHRHPGDASPAERGRPRDDQPTGCTPPQQRRRVETLVVEAQSTPQETQWTHTGLTSGLDRMGHNDDAGNDDDELIMLTSTSTTRQRSSSLPPVRQDALVREEPSPLPREIAHTRIARSSPQHDQPWTQNQWSHNGWTPS